MDAFAGTGVPHDATLLAASLRDGDWIEAGLHGLSGALGAAGAAADPIAALTSAGVGWAIEHIGPLREMLDDLAGDPAAVMADAGRLDEAAVAVLGTVEDVWAATPQRLAGMEGLAVTAAADFARAAVRDCVDLSELVHTGAEAMRMASGLVATVRSLVRDAISELVGMATSSAVAAFATAGTAVPALVARVAFRARALTARLSSTMAALARSVEALRVLLVRAEGVLEELVRVARSRRPARVPLPSSPVEAWTSQMVRRIDDIRPTLEVLHTTPGGAAVAVAGPPEREAVSR